MQPAYDVLIVEDDGDIRLGLLEVIEMEGYLAHTAGNGREALELIESRGLPRLIVLDFLMPVMNGPDFLKTIRTEPRYSNLSKIPVIMLTASERAGELADAQVVPKPPDLQLLFKIVQSHCRPGISG